MNPKEGDLRKTIYKQLEAHVRTLPPGTRLPSEPSLAIEYGVSRTTIRSVLDTLDSSGLIYRRRGSGTYVNPKPFLAERTLSHYLDYSTMIAEKGYKVTRSSTRKVLFCKDKEISDALHQPLSQQIIRIETVYHANGLFAACCQDNLPCSLVSKASLAHFLYRLSVDDIPVCLLDEIGMILAETHVDLQGVLGNEIPSIAPYLVAGELRPLILMKTTSYNQVRNPLMYSRTYLDTRFLDLQFNR